MGYFEDFYSEQEASKKKSNSVDYVKKYNRDVDIIRDVKAKIIESIKLEKPDFYDWIDYNGKRIIGWKIFESDSESRYDSLYLLSDWSLVQCKYDSKIVYKTISFEHISSATEASYEKVRVICLEMMRSCQGGHFKVNYEPSWDPDDLYRLNWHNPEKPKKPESRFWKWANEK